MAKTPFEIRHDLLKMASDHLMNEYYAKLEVARAEADRLAVIDTDLSRFGLEETKARHPDPYANVKGLKYPTIEDIIDLAGKLKVFVDANQATV